jgi:hypothetical protein
VEANRADGRSVEEREWTAYEKSMAVTMGNDERGIDDIQR